MIEDGELPIPPEVVKNWKILAPKGVPFGQELAALKIAGELYFAKKEDQIRVVRVDSLLALLTQSEGLFAERELLFLLKRADASRILGIPTERTDVGDLAIGDLIVRGEIREWSNLPETFKPQGGEKRGISLLSVFEYMVRREGGIVEETGRFSSDKNQVNLQREVLKKILIQLPEFG